MRALFPYAAGIRHEGNVMTEKAGIFDQGARLSGLDERHLRGYFTDVLYEKVLKREITSLIFGDKRWLHIRARALSLLALVEKVR